MRGGTPAPHPPETAPHFLPLDVAQGFILMETRAQPRGPATQPLGKEEGATPKANSFQYPHPQAGLTLISFPMVTPLLGQPQCPLSPPPPPPSSGHSGLRLCSLFLGWVKGGGREPELSSPEAERTAGLEPWVWLYGNHRRPAPDLKLRTTGKVGREETLGRTAVLCSEGANKFLNQR